MRGTVTAERGADGLVEVYTEEPIDGTDRVSLRTPDELGGMVAEYNGVKAGQPATQPQETQAAEPQQTTVGAVKPEQSEQLGTQQPAPAAQEASAETVEPMPMLKDRNGKDTEEPDFSQVTPERAKRYIYDEEVFDTADESDAFVQANIDAAQKSLAKVKKKEPKMGTSITAYKKAKAEIADELEQAQAQVDYWNAVKAEQDKAVAAERAGQAAKDAAAHDAAVEEERQYREAEKKKAEERAAVGNNNVMPQVKERYDKAPKYYGNEDVFITASGKRYRFRWYATTPDATTPSHDPFNGFRKSEGVPVNEQGNTLNDRDYERDKDAQEFTRDIAARYDGRAIQDPVLNDKNGITVSDNGRDIAGKIAAKDGTDAAYLEDAKQLLASKGISEEALQLPHMRIQGELVEDVPYTTDVFADFNAQSMKSQSKTEQSVKLGQVVKNDVFNRIINSINGFETLGEFYNNATAAREAITELKNAGVITQQQMAEMFDGDSISAVARELLENTLVGKAFESNPDAVRMLSSYKSMRQRVVGALAEISNNIRLGEDYSLEQELAKAVKLCYDARQAGYKDGVRVSAFARQGVLFGDDGDTVADYRNATVMMLADLLNDTRISQLKKVFTLYNQRAKENADGQLNLLTGIDSKEDILKDILKLLDYGTDRQRKEAIGNAVEQRKAGVQQNDPAGGSGEGSQQGSVQGASDAGVRENPLSTQNSQSRRASTVNIRDPRDMSDAEKLHRGEMLREAYAIEVKENQIVSTPELSARKAAEKWWDENVAEPSFYDTEAGEVEINKNTAVR